jgi:ribosomal protein L33
MFSSYQKQALTVMISPLCTNCHDKIWKIWRTSQLKSEKILKKYCRKVGEIVKRFEKYGRNPS